MDEFQRGVRAGLSSAAQMLRDVAADYAEMSQRKAQEKPALDVASARRQIATDARIMSEKAVLLRHQADEVAHIRITRGR